jgi:hypothetical protein
MAPGTGGIRVGGGRDWAIWRAWQAIQCGFGRDGHSETWRKLRHLKGWPVGTTAHRAERVCASCKPKVYRDRRCVDTFPGQHCNGEPWDAGGYSGAEDIGYETHSMSPHHHASTRDAMCSATVISTLSGCVTGLRPRTAEGVRRVQCSPVQCWSSETPVPCASGQGELEGVPTKGCEPVEG